jgi:type IV pilus assembly protein PilB
MLIQAGVVTEKQLEEALKEQESTGDRLGSTLIKLGFISEETLAQFLSQQLRVPAVNLLEEEISPEVLPLISPEMAHRYQVVPLDRMGRLLTLAMVNPTDIYAIEDIKFHTGLEVSPAVATEGSVRKALDTYYAITTDVEALVRKGQAQSDLELMETVIEEEDISQLEASGKSAPVVKLVNFLITNAVNKRASDIHIEPYEKVLRVRFRVDGVLTEVMSPPYRLKGAITTRVKVMASLDIAERRVPQDGRIKVRVGEKVIDLRVSVVPTLYGEKVVMRILDQSSLMLDMTDLGFEEDTLERFLTAIESPYGIVLVTGPTGSGKSTTLYSALNRLNNTSVHILTVEEPVEYNLRGINQVQVNEEIGLTFASALRAFLRQSPDIIMVGEIRDTETAEIGVRSALTGHLVLSTIHTNDAPSTINRLIDMGIEPFLVAASLNLIQAQRLVRRICPKCRVKVEVPPRVLREAKIDPDEVRGHTWRGEGCSECGHFGYKGRIALFEAMPITSEIRNLILSRASTAAIMAKAKEAGMRTLREDGLMKVKRGITTIEEVIRETASI